MNQSKFLYPRSRYRGKCKPEYLVFNANLQEFTQRVSYISALQTGGKISAEQAYQDIKCLWKQLKHSKQQLGIGTATEQL
ncbi:Isopropylmalate/homocitrate/citramalate synthases [uncultured Leptolyngbya sp.]|uniref:Isopropylmalate/homocitrate/citramalate synthases n=1 Tax=uncultured Leptolyngbya sp. TaxID=332963 RepID=A0A6J4NWF2_9CYAN|nr:Isopropylmalate/homocitrate/citramalate synthases [uncultured Leptolyngbya sp.]